MNDEEVKVQRIKLINEQIRRLKVFEDHICTESGHETDKSSKNIELRLLLALQ